MKELIRNEKLEEQMEERRKESKEANIIIYGVEENEDKSEFVNKLLQDVNMITKTNYISRIGTKSIRTRPIKVVFSSGHEKYKFTRKLTELRHHHRYSKISVTDDMTKMERELMKKWKEEADERNQRDPNEKYKWRVRGSPRDGLYLKKIHIL